MSFFDWLLFLFFIVIFSFNLNFLAFLKLEFQFALIYLDQHLNEIVDPITLIFFNCKAKQNV